MKKSTEQKNSAELVIERLKEVLNLRFDTELSEYLELNATGTLSNWKKRDSVNWGIILTKCENVSADYLKTGKGSPFINSAKDIKSELNYLSKELSRVEEEASSYISQAGNAETLREALRIRKELSRLSGLIESKINELL